MVQRLVDNTDVNWGAASSDVNASYVPFLSSPSNTVEKVLTGGLQLKTLDAVAVDDAVSKQQMDTAIASISLGGGVVGQVSNLLALQTNVTTLTVDFDSVVVSGTGGEITLSAPASPMTAVITASGINGLDTGAEAIDTWYYIWVLHKKDGGSNETVLILSTSETAPTIPDSAYTHKTLVSAVRNNAAGDFIDFQHSGKRYEFAGLALSDTEFTSSAAVITTHDFAAYVPSALVSSIFGNIKNTDMVGSPPGITDPTLFYFSHKTFIAADVNSQNQIQIGATTELTVPTRVIYGMSQFESSVTVVGTAINMYSTTANIGGGIAINIRGFLTK